MPMIMLTNPFEIKENSLEDYNIYLPLFWFPLILASMSIVLLYNVKAQMFLTLVENDPSFHQPYRYLKEFKNSSLCFFFHHLI